MLNKKQVARKMTNDQLRNYLSIPVSTENIGKPSEVRKMKMIVQDELQIRLSRDADIILSKMPSIIFPQRKQFKNDELSNIFGIEVA